MPPTPQPVLLEVLAHIPTDFFHCLHCERLFAAAGVGAPVRQEIQAEYPPEMLQDAERLGIWLQDLVARYGERLRIRIVDPQSPEGFYKSVRYWVRRYPTFVINYGQKYTGWETAALDRLLEEHMARGAYRDQGRG